MGMKGRKFVDYTTEFGSGKAVTVGDLKRFLFESGAPDDAIVGGMMGKAWGSEIKFPAWNHEDRHYMRQPNEVTSIVFSWEEVWEESNFNPPASVGHDFHSGGIVSPDGVHFLVNDDE
jgi:hypothetical protein